MFKPVTLMSTMVKASKKGVVDIGALQRANIEVRKGPCPISSMCH